MAGQSRALFPVGTLAGEDDVVDRGPFLDEVTARLASGQSVLTAGPRRIGKASGSREVLRRLSQRNFYTADVDLLLATGEESFAALLTQAVLESRVGLKSWALHMWGEVMEWVQGLSLAGRMAGVDIELSQAPSILTRGNILGARAFSSRCGASAAAMGTARLWASSRTFIRHVDELLLKEADMS